MIPDLFRLSQMINRTRVSDSIYKILDEDPKEINKYIEAEAKKKPEQKEKEKEARNKKSSIEDVNLNENLNNQESEPSNQVIIHTEADNLVHNYFHFFNMYWDSKDPLSSAILKLPKTDTGNTKYWITYTGEITIYLGSDIKKKQEQTTNDKNNTTSSETYWGLQGAQPIFRGDIGRIKEFNDTLEIHVDSIGKRFKQKIPDEFRQAFINNQNVRDAFQAICEFLGVKYICPPGAPPEEDEGTDETSPADGTENNVNGTTQQEQQLASAASQQAASAIQNASQNNTNGDQNNQSTDPNAQNANTEDSLNEDGEQSDIQNGYSDISFDANGSIVHGSTAIETSPDMEDTLLALEEHPLDKYLEDTTYVATDVKRFLDGEMFDTVHNSVMNYDAITIEPKSSASSEMSSVGGGVAGGDASGANSGNGSPEANSGNVSATIGRPNLGLNVDVNVHNGGIYLSNEYINSLPPAQAGAKLRCCASNYNTSTRARLFKRSIGGFATG